MTKNPSLGQHHIDLQKLLETRLLVQAQSGGGKSWCLRRLLEQTAPHVQQLVLDPEGEYPARAVRLPARHTTPTRSPRRKPPRCLPADCGSPEPAPC